LADDGYGFLYLAIHKMRHLTLCDFLELNYGFFDPLSEPYVRKAAIAVFLFDDSFIDQQFYGFLDRRRRIQVIGIYKFFENKPPPTATCP